MSFGLEAVIDQSIAPLAGHDEDCVLVEFGADEWIHLGHVAAEPAGSGGI
jgi:hypothetical protein